MKGDEYLITAKTLLEETIAMPEVTKDIFSNGLITLKDRISITTLLAYILSELEFLPEAKDILIKTRETFEGTIETFICLKFLARFAIQKNDFDEAVQIMDSVPCVSI